MTSDPQQLRDAIDRLKQELADAEAGDPQVRALLREAVDELEARLDDDAPQDEDHPDGSLIDRLGHAARHYEETHPTLSGIVGSVIDTLSRMGI